MRDKYKQLFVILGLAIAVFAVFCQVRSFEFVRYDDDRYVSNNNHILSGLKLRNIAWVFTSEHCDNWHPLTGISHILDCELFGSDAGRHHLVNMIFHIVNTVLIFVVFRRLTSAFWQSAFIAAVFGLHPAHVESVAWISERKDVLSTMFWLLTMAAYFHYIKHATISRYLLTLAIFVMGLMSKPMLVTLPFVLLLLDYWPLNRLEAKNKGQIYRLVREKIPFFVFSAVSCVITVVVQSKVGALKNIEQFSLSTRVYNAIVSYVRYIDKMVWPVDLAVFYPYQSVSPLQVLASLVLLVVVTVLVVRASGRHKYLFTGWFWYLGTLVPVIGLVQVGNQSMADRYTYVPYIGLFIIVAWGANDLTDKLKYRKIVLGALSSAIVLILAVLTWFQVSYWHDSISLFTHAIDVTSGNYLAYNNRGVAYNAAGMFDLAISDYDKVLEIKPKYIEAYNNRGIAYEGKGEYGRAISDFNRALGMNSEYAEAYYNRGNLYAKSKVEANLAISDYSRAIEIKQDFADAYVNRGNVYRDRGQFDLAISDYNKALAMNPGEADVYNNRGNAYEGKGQLDNAISDYDRALEINPKYDEAYYNRATVYQRKGKYDAAVRDYDKALEIDPKYSQAYFNKAVACELAGRKTEAIKAYKAFVRYAPARYHSFAEQARQKIKELEKRN
jgi:tetratricopeptide (TPR) repeat protein